MKNILLVLVLLSLTTAAFAQADKVTVTNNSDGMTLEVNGEEMMINGMNWDYVPIGTNFNYSLWKQPDDLIQAALDSEMSLLKNMGVNTVRMYTGVPPRWIKYIYNKYGIYTMLNHPFGRYGLTIDGSWVAVTDYRDSRTQAILLAEVTELASTYKDTPGLLLFLLGNENNYGLFWAGAETEAFPDEEEERAFIGESRGRPMYKLMNEAAKKIKAIDGSHPVAMCNGDVLFLEIIAEECQDVDIYGTNMYRGVSFGDAFQKVKDVFNKPILFTEFGADAFSAVNNAEDQQSQAYYMVGNWKEIYENAAGLGKAGNSLGGFTFQFSDGWWKFGQTKNLEVHDNNASWPNGGYASDFVEGENNMNEEWFGICAKGPNNERGLYQLFPRAAYYALKEAHTLDPYSAGTSLQSIETHFSDINLMEAVLQGRGNQAALVTEELKKIRLSNFRADLSTFYTGGSLISTPEDPTPGQVSFPDELGFDHMQSFFFGVEARPAENFRATATFNVLGNVALNPIDEIFYENRGRSQVVEGPNGDVVLGDVNRMQLYRASFNWKGKMADVDGFYRTGHYHWGYEGDFFGLYPEANYGPNIDIYNGNAPFGVEVTGKKELEGLKVAFGPELWWAANPAFLVKYSRSVAGFDATAIYHEDIDNLANTVSSFAIPQPLTRRVTLHLKREIGPIGLEIGGIWGGQPLVGRSFQLVDADLETDKQVAYQDQVNNDDTWGGKVKVMYSNGPFRWYGQAAAMGLVANGGADATRTYTGWRLKDSGSGNQMNFLSGFTFRLGNLEIAPNFLWQKPLVGPVPTGLDAPARPRNILDDPFVVRGNREQVAGEILFTYDPTPGTWMYEWDNDFAEDAPFAISAGFVYRHLPTTQDAAIGILADGRSIFAFPGAPQAQDLWEVHSRIVSKINPELGFIANIYGGTAQSNGSDQRLIERVGGDVRLIYKQFKMEAMAKVNDWGPFDYHRDFNLTFPLQLALDMSTTLGKPNWLGPAGTRMGLRYSWRTLNEFSNRYCPVHTTDASGAHVCDPTAPGFEDGREWEFRTYLQVNIGN